MNSLIVIKRTPITTNSGAKDVSLHLCERMYYGKVVIVVDNPKVFIGTLRKEWLKLARKVQLERASTLDITKIAALSGDASYMLRLRFTTHYPPDEYPGDVFVVSPKEALTWAPDCRTMYIISHVERHQQYLLTSWMSRGSLVVIYEQAE